MLQNKSWLLVVFSLLLIPCLAYGQETPDMPDYVSPSAPTGSTVQATWDIILSSQIIADLADKNWRTKESQLVKDVLGLNPDLSKFRIIPQGKKRTLLFTREIGNKQEKLTVETDPEALSKGAGKTKPLNELEMNGWLQTDSQANIRKIANSFRQGQVFWTLSALAQSVTEAGPPKDTPGKDPTDKAKGTQPPASDSEQSKGKEGWFTRVITHSTLVSNFRKGGFIMYFILLCSLGGVYIGLERGYEVRRKRLMPAEFLEGILTKLPEKPLTDNDHKKLLQLLISYCEEHDTPISRVLKSGLFVFNQGVLGIKSAVVSANHHEAAILGRSLGLLEVLANISPLLGLLGTVLGMIKAFEMIAIAGGTGRAEVVAAGISEALITTAGGLLVGIPLLVTFHFLEGKIDVCLIEAEEFCMDVVERLIRTQEEG